jgi:hypothetical protein
MAIQSYSGTVVVMSNGHRLTIDFAGGSIEDINKLGSKVGAAIDKELGEIRLNAELEAENQRLVAELSKLRATPNHSFVVSQSVETAVAGDSGLPKSKRGR